ncbi:MAG: class I SAM-dependent methyltransferase [Pseudomonadota bacterium]
MQLLNVIAPTQTLSVNDIGCGYGALAGFMHRRLRGVAIDYLGTDLSPEMIALARRKNRRRSVCFEQGPGARRLADYSLASGIFNVRLHHPLDVWEAFVARALTDMANTSRIGFAVNFLAPAPQDPTQLYRADASFWVEYCRTRLDMQTQLLQDYGMREFTLLARRIPR